MNFKIYIFSLLVILVCGKESEEQYRRLPNAIAVVGRTFEYFLPPREGSKQQYKVCSDSRFMHKMKWISLIF